MNRNLFEKFSEACAENLADSVDEILRAAQGEQFCAIGFVTTDDFYGFYLSWACRREIDEFYEWDQGMYPEYLYQPLVDIVDACKEIDFCEPSDEKWDFAQGLLTVLEENIQRIPQQVFQKNHFKREDVLFFAAMSDGDYVQEMLDASIKRFNAPETVKAYGLG